MNQDVKNLLMAQLINDEGRRRFPYLDTATPPQITIGIGRDLSAKGLSTDEQNFLFQNDLKDAEADARFVLGDCFDGLSTKRQVAMLNMAFNLGRLRMSGFKNMVAAVQAGNFTAAAAAMRASKWHSDVGARAERLASMMESG